MSEIRIPRRFYDDHASRELPTPEALRETQRHVWISPEDPHLPELVNDARYYAHPYGPDLAPKGTKAAARALLNAIPGV